MQTRYHGAFSRHFREELERRWSEDRRAPIESDAAASGRAAAPLQELSRSVWPFDPFRIRWTRGPPGAASQRRIAIETGSDPATPVTGRSGVLREGPSSSLVFLLSR